MSIPLPDASDLPQVCASASGAAPSVLDLGTTAKVAEPQGKSVGHFRFVPDEKKLDELSKAARERFDAAFPPEQWTQPEPRELPEWCADAEWSGDLEFIWSARTRRDVVSLEARARRYRAAAAALLAWQENGGEPPEAPGLRRVALTRNSMVSSSAFGRGVWPARGSVVVGHGAITPDGRRVELLRAAEWCENRARATAMSRRDVVGACRGRWRTVACGCARREIEVGCDQPMLCGWCRKRHWLRWRRRITRAMGPHLRAAVDAWNRAGGRGPRPGIYLVTLTAPHSGDLVVDRRVMGDAWRELSKRASYGGYRHGERWYDEKWWGHHAMVYEATKGTKGDGHLHAHAAVISQWVPYKEMRAAWEQAIPGAVVVDVVSPQEQAKRASARGKKANGVGDAAFYLAKYVTKGVEPSELSGRKAGELLVAFRNRRKVTTSRHFWRPLRDREATCKGCGQIHRLVESPVGLQEHAPAAVMSSLMERSRWRPPRGAPQVRLRW